MEHSAVKALRGLDSEVKVFRLKTQYFLLFCGLLLISILALLIVFLVALQAEQGGFFIVVFSVLFILGLNIAIFFIFLKKSSKRKFSENTKSKHLLSNRDILKIYHENR